MGLNDFNPLGQVQGVFAEPATRDFTQPQKMHHTYIWLGSIRIMLYVLLVGVLSSISSIMQGMSAASDAGVLGMVLLIILGSAVVIFGIVAAIRVLDYRNRSYVLSDTEFNLYSGIITKRHLHVPYQRIQSIDETAGLLQRLAGVTTLKIDTAGGAANKAIMLEYLGKETAQALRTELFARKQVLAAGGSIVNGQVILPGAAATEAENGAAAPAAAAVTSAAAAAAAMGVETAPVTYSFGLSNREVIFASISNNTAVTLIIVGFFTALVTALGIFLDNASTLSLVVALVGVAISLSGAVLMWLIGGLASYLQLGNFSARRRGNRIEVEQGLTRRFYQGVDIDRVQNVTIRQGLIRRFMGYCEVSLGKIEAQGQESGGGRNNVSTGVIVHPFVKVDLVPQILAGLVPEFAWVPSPQYTLPPVATRRVIFRRITWANVGFWIALGTLLVQIPVLIFAADPMDRAIMNTVAGITYAICAIITIPNVISGLLWKKESFFAYDNRGMMIRNGGFNTTTVVLPRTKIQFSYLRCNPFQRASKVRTLVVRTAAGVGGSDIMLRDVAEDRAYDWYDWTKPGALRRLQEAQAAAAAQALTGQVQPAPAVPEGSVPVHIDVTD